MPRRQKCFLHNCAYEITFRTEVGLPLVAGKHIVLLLKSLLARAMQAHSVKLVAIVAMGNHIHMIVVVEDPEDLPDFIEYFKRESALAINRLLGREKHTVWEEGYESPIILDPAKLIERLVYFYTNPQRSRLTDTIEEYPQLNSWKAMISGQTNTETVPVFPRTATEFGADTASAEVREQIFQSMIAKKNGEIEFVLQPFAWLNCFPETAGQNPAPFIKEIVARVRSSEYLIRREHGNSVLGTNALLNQDMRQPHIPKKRGKRSICRGSDRVRCREFLGWFLEEAKQAREAIRRWIENKGTLWLPSGFFAPGGTLFSNVLPQFLVT